MVDPIKRALLRYLPFSPAILLAVLLPLYWVDVPQYDEWDSVTLFEHLSQGSLTIGLLFKQVNEYRQFFPNVIFVGFGKLTHWDLRYEMIRHCGCDRLNVRDWRANYGAAGIQFNSVFRGEPGDLFFDAIRKLVAGATTGLLHADPVRHYLRDCGAREPQCDYQVFSLCRPLIYQYVLFGKRRGVLDCSAAAFGFQRMAEKPTAGNWVKCSLDCRAMSLCGALSLWI
jgi:hypothetical protein